MTDNVKETAREFFAEQDRTKGQLSDAVCAGGYTCYIGTFPPMTREQHNALASVFWGAFPDLRQEIDEMIGESDRVAVRFRIKGTHTGPLMDVEPSGKSVDIGGMALVRVTAGRVLELREEFDQHGLMQQIGAIPSE